MAVIRLFMAVMLAGLVWNGQAGWFRLLPEHKDLCKPAEDIYNDCPGTVRYGNMFSLDVGPDYEGKLRDIDVKMLKEAGRRIVSDTVYVSATGDARGTGTKEAPFASLRQAIDFACGHKRVSTVMLREGRYDLGQTIEIKGLQKRLTITSYPGEKVFVTGGKRISHFTPLDKNSLLYERFPASARENILQADLRKAGITAYGEIKSRGFGRPVQPSGLMLYFNGKPMTLARWPDDAWARIKDVPEEMHGKGFRYAGDRPARWKNAKDIWMHGYWKWDWADSYEKIKSIDTRKKEITVADPQSPYPYTKGKRYYVFNLPEELDAPGEWYLDRETGMLYFYPPGVIEKAEVTVSLLEEPLFKITDCPGVVLENLTLEYSNGAGVLINNGSNNVIRNCVFRGFGAVAVSIGNMEAGSEIYGNPLYNGDAGTKNGVSGCTVSYCGEGGVILGGGDRKTLTPGKNFVENTRIFKASQWVRTYRAGVFMYGAGNIVRHNEIYELPHTALFFWGNDHTVEYNNIHHVCMETADAGAVYNGRDWTQRGHLIRYNYIHHLHGVETQGGFQDVMGVYLDDFSSGTTVYGNIFYKAGRNILIGGGRENLVENNIFIEGMPAVHVDARGIGWAKNNFENTGASILYKRYELVNGGAPPYSTRYPRLAGLPGDDPALPKYNCIENNIFCGGKWRELRNHLNDTIVCFRNNVIKDHCDFYRIRNNTIQIDFSAGIFPAGFEKIAVSEIGIKKK